MGQLRVLILDKVGEEFEDLEEIEVFENGFKKNVLIDKNKSNKLMNGFNALISKDQCVEIFRDFS